jgi:TonB-dependent receptor-like protein
MRRIQFIYLTCAAFTALSVGACASTNNGAPPENAVPASHSPNVITQAEIESTGTSNALQAVQRLRPNFLVTRGNTSRNSADIGVVVYANGTRLGGASTLSQISVQDVSRIEYLNASEATQRFGTGHTHGAILVTRK